MTAEDASNTEEHPLRLHRLERIFPHAPVYFVTTCTAGRRALLANAQVHNAFITFANQGMEHGVWIGRYVLMPDHLHFFVAYDDERTSLPAIIKSLKNALSKALRAMKIEPPHWQKGFFDHVLRSGESYSEKWEYVRLNPVRAGLVLRSDDWAYHGEISPLDVRRS